MKTLLSALRASFVAATLLVSGGALAEEGEATGAPGSATPVAATPATVVAQATGSAAARIVLRASAEAWVRVRDEGGRTYVDRVLAAGQTWDVPERGGLLLDTGNAEGLEVLVDGAAAPSLWWPGISRVRRNLPLDAERLRAGKIEPVRTATLAPAKAAPADAPVAAPVVTPVTAPVVTPVAAPVVTPPEVASKPVEPPVPMAPPPAAPPAPVMIAATPAPPPSPMRSETATLRPDRPPSALPLPTPQAAVPVALARSSNPPAPATMAAQPVAVGGGTLIPPSGEVVRIEMGKGALLRLRQPAETIFIAEPEIADVQVKSPGILYVYGKKAGETVLYAVDKSDRVILSSRISVSHNLGALRQAIDRLLPDGTVEVDSVDGSIVLSGFVASAQQAEDLRRLAQRFAPNENGVLNQLQVVAPTQINLRVRIAEVSRTTLKELGFNTDALLTFGSFALGVATGNPVIIGSTLLARNASALGGGTTNSLIASYRGRNVDLNTVIDALANEGIIGLLAEPNLTALSGETASFLAGGEFPIPVPQDRETITIVFKTFGVSLAFTPTLLDGDRINLKVRPEVSELSSSGAVQFNGITIPALTTRRAETTIELGSGQSFAIAGLLQNNTRQEANKTPVLGEVPVLGPLFKSDRFRRNETELAIIVTPYMVRPVSAQRLATPNDGLVAPSDVERILGGSTFRQQIGRRTDTPRGKDGQPLIGPAGFMLE